LIVAVETIGLLHENRATGRIHPEERQHLTEPATARLFGGFDIDKLSGDGQMMLTGVLSHPDLHALLVQSIYRGALLPASQMPVSLKHDKFHNEHVIAINCMDQDDLEPDLTVQDLATRDVYVVRMQDDKPIQKIWVSAHCRMSWPRETSTAMATSIRCSRFPESVTRGFSTCADSTSSDIRKRGGATDAAT
jgi:hypothetical protein